ncbi:MAG: PhoX family phosphatase [Hyphomicrobiaceae bacterium]|nr:MAG: PhoX family phosphatase [Hyphomicrobiaceae bacterium]
MGDDGFSNKDEAFQAFDDIPLSPPREDTIGAIIARRYSRREMLKGSLGVTAATTLFGTAALTSASSTAEAAAAPAAFRELTSGIDETHHVAEGYQADIVIRWGDPLFKDMKPFDPRTLTGEDQARRFGYNNDYIAFFRLNRPGTRGLLCVNHEYANPEVMFAGVGGRPDKNDFAKITAAHVAVEMAAHGVSVVEIALDRGKWRPVVGSRFNRRITALTEMTADGPAAGHERMKTKADPAGRKLWGTINNCAGGQTPWGTYLTGEENSHGYFWTDQKGPDGKRLTKGIGGPLQKTNERYGIPSNWYSWGRFHERFNVDKEPNECHRFNWIVEVDPFNPNSRPVKHTALGRFRHEGAETIVNKDGRVVVYSGDDSPFEYIYRFVSRNRFKPGDKAHNMRLLSEGTLSVARFDADGTMKWLPLVFGTGPLTPENGFNSQADVVMYARSAADLLKATPMDRPEDVQPHPTSGRVYAMLTNNARRRPEQVDKANPRPHNDFGHIIEMTSPKGDHAAETFTWDLLIKCGDPRVAEVGAMWNPATTADGWFACPDNCTFDAQGRLWVATDQGREWARKTKKADGLYAIGTEGKERGLSRLFFRCPVGAEMCGPCFTPNGQTLFLAVQHPATDGVRDWQPFGRDSTFEDPATRWPDFKPDMPPRPSVVAIRKKGGGEIA